MISQTQVRPHYSSAPITENQSLLTAHQVLPASLLLFFLWPHLLVLLPLCCSGLTQITRNPCCSSNPLGEFWLFSLPGMLLSQMAAFLTTIRSVPSVCCGTLSRSPPSRNEAQSLAVGVLTACESSWPSPSPGGTCPQQKNCFTQSQAPFPGQPVLNDCGPGSIKGLSPSPQFRITSKGYPSSRAPHRVSCNFCCTCITT